MEKRINYLQTKARLVPIEALTAKVEAERARLRQEVGLPETFHFRRPTERPFLAHERGRVTILFGGLTWKHEELIRPVFLANGYTRQ